MSWIFLAASAAAITLQLRGDWFNVYAILMRQSCTVLSPNKTVIIFIMATIIFTYGYEGVISSFLTVPPPVHIFKSLKELLQNGYKVNGYNPAADAVHRDLIPIFRRENITPTDDLRPGLVSESYYSKYGGSFEALAHCNITASMITSNLRKAQSFLMAMFELVDRCNFVTDTVLPSEALYQFLGHSHLTLAKATQVLWESGVMGYIYHFAAYVKSYQTDRNQDVFEYKEEKKEVSFEMSDSRILSIFLGWAALLTCVFGAFLLELVFEHGRRTIKNPISCLYNYYAYLTAMVFVLY